MNHDVEPLTPEALSTIRLWAVTELGTERGQIAHYSIDRFVSKMTDFLRLNLATLDRERAVSLCGAREAAPPPLDERPADWMTCGIGGCDFTVERGEARDMALHRDEDHPAAPPPLDELDMVTTEPKEPTHV